MNGQNSLEERERNADRLHVPCYWSILIHILAFKGTLPGCRPPRQSSPNPCQVPPPAANPQWDTFKSDTRKDLQEELYGLWIFSISHVNNVWIQQDPLCPVPMQGTGWGFGLGFRGQNITAKLGHSTNAWRAGSFTSWAYFWLKSNQETVGDPGGEVLTYETQEVMLFCLQRDSDR